MSSAPVVTAQRRDNDTDRRSPIAGELRLTLFLYRANALGNITAEKSEHLHRERRIEGGAEHPDPVVQRTLGKSSRLLRTIRELACDFKSLVPQLVSGRA